MEGSRLVRLGPVGGIVFVGLWIVAFALRFAKEPGPSDSEIVSYYADSANVDREISSSFLMILAGLFFLWFLVTMRARLASAEGSAGPYTALAFAAGLVAASLWFVAAVFFMAVAYTMSETAEFAVDPDTYRLVSEIGYLLWVAGTVVAVLLVLAASLLGRRGELVPGWLGWIGVAIAAAMLATALFVGFLLFLLWTLAVSVALLVRREREAPALRA